MSFTTLGSGAGNSAQIRTAGQPGVCLGTPILTMDGEIPVEYLTEGDRIVTRAGAALLQTITVTTLRPARAVRIQRDVLGLGRPTGTITVAAAQPLLIRDWRAKALFGTPTAVIPAARLVDGNHIRAASLPELRLFTLGFAGDAVIYANGVELFFSAARSYA